MKPIGFSRVRNTDRIRMENMSMDKIWTARASVAAIAFLGMMILFHGCDVLNLDADTIYGSGNIVALSRGFTDFDEITFNRGFSATITRADSFSIRIRVDDNIVDYLRVNRVSNSLTITLDGDYSFIDVHLEADITLPALISIVLMGGSQADADGFDTDEAFNAVISGGSRLDGTMNTGALSGLLSGGSSLTIIGEGDDLDLDLSGGSAATLNEFNADDALVLMSGASQARIRLSGTLNARLSGESRLFYYGEPTLGSITTTGGSYIEYMGS